MSPASRVPLADDALIVRDVAAAVGLREGERGVRAVIAALARLEPVSIRRLSRTVALPVPIVASVCGELRKRLVVADEPPAQLTSAGRRLFGDGRLRLPGTGTCPTCAGRGVISPGEFSGIARELATFVEKAPPRRLDLDQCQCTVGTKLRRVLAMHEADALVGRRILLLGDDDLTSLAIAAVVQHFGSASTISRLVVLDADAALVEFLAAELIDAPFPCSCRHHDLRDPLPPEFLGAFDTVATDPPYTVAAARLFLSRAADALTGPGGSVFLSFGSRRPEAPFRLQQAIAEMGFATRRLVPDFNDYFGAGALGGTSQLYHLVATEHLRSLISETYGGPLYTMQLR
jgi:N4-bis(aminopropyl)spermidine synthase